ncbi:MAG: hypothetical protein K0R61_1939 [Microvirga sp.]|nr:hypothetical protein [Microvirga sp.]
MESGVHLRRNLDKHHHGFVVAVRTSNLSRIVLVIDGGITVLLIFRSGCSLASNRFDALGLLFSAYFCCVGGSKISITQRSS